MGAYQSKGLSEKKAFSKFLLSSLVQEFNFPEEKKQKGSFHGLPITGSSRNTPHIFSSVPRLRIL